VTRWGSNDRSVLGAAVLIGALSAGCVLTGAMPARAGFLDFLFSAQPEQPSSQVSAYAAPTAPIGRVAPPPMGSESVRQGNEAGGRGVAFCVRLCDGQQFPLERMANATPVETCSAMCPAAKTKIYFGGAIDYATAKDGARYADLDTAFTYRKHVVPNCTCNGKTAYGLVPLNASNDSTLRPGDIVSTRTGFVTYTGKTGQANAFTPANTAAITAELIHRTPPRERLAKRSAPIEEQAGTILQSKDSQQPEPVAGLRSLFAR
jgi:Protein of unknown function (DUF2865)